MKHLFVTLMLAALTAGAALAQSASDGRDADRDALRALGRRYEEAINTGNLKALADAIEPTASAVFITGDEVTGIEAMQRFLEEVKKIMGEGSHYSVKLVPNTTEFFGDIALAKGTSDETATFGSGRQLFYTTHWTAVLRKIDGQWKATRLHVSGNLFDNPILNIAKKTALWAAIASLVVGALLGWVVGRRRKPAP